VGQDVGVNGLDAINLRANVKALDSALPRGEAHRPAARGVAQKARHHFGESL
jgi:hypothetical protein